MENNEAVQKCGPKFCKKSNFRALLPCSPACLNFYMATSWPLRLARLHGKSVRKFEF